MKAAVYEEASSTHNADRQRTDSPSEGANLDVINIIDLVDEVNGIAVASLVLQVRFVNFHVIGKFAILLQLTSLIGSVLSDDVALFVLEVSKRDQDDVTQVDPDLLSHLASNVAQTLGAVTALNLASAVAQHAKDGTVFLADILELQFLLHLGVVGLGPLGLVTSELVLRHLRCSKLDGNFARTTGSWWSSRIVNEGRENDETA
mmetsp:Transcript_24333/g.36918  ORF Transcript_24333/g.36918 Transcript_24333/m.36918 type:complete len:204 (-) Transcript_24333:9-620(-)